MRARSCSLIAAAVLMVACGEAVEAPGPSPSSAGAGNGGSAGTGVAGAGASGKAGTAGTGSGGVGTGGASGGAAGSAGSSAGSAGTSGTAGGGSGGVPPIECKPWPAAVGATEDVPDTIKVSGTFDGKLKRFRGTGNLNSGGQAEDQPPFFRLANGAVLKNVILAAPAADGIHCDGNCTLQNVWWEDVGEDAATLDGTSSSQTMTIECAGAKKAADKIFQHNGPGTMVMKNIYADDFGKLYRSCGNCLDQYTRHAKLENVTLKNGPIVAGINENYDDTAEFKNITVSGSVTICQRYEGNDTGAEPRQLGSGADGTHCIYSSSDIHKQ